MHEKCRKFSAEADIRATHAFIGFLNSQKNKIEIYFLSRFSSPKSIFGVFYTAQIVSLQLASSISRAITH